MLHRRNSCVEGTLSRRLTQSFSAVISYQASSRSLATGCQEGLFPGGSQVPGGPITTGHTLLMQIQEGAAGKGTLVAWLTRLSFQLSVSASTRDTP